MGEQALQALQYLQEKGPTTLATSIEVLELLSNKGLIIQHDPTMRRWKLTPYGKGVLLQIRKAGTEAMVEKMESYL